jgi:hypothetical protein
MDFFNQGVDFAVLAAKAFGLPIILIVIGATMIDRFAPSEFHTVPILRRSALLGGILLGCLLLLALPGAEHLRPSAIWVKGGPWDLNFGQFLSDRIAAYGGSLADLYTRPLNALSRMAQAAIIAHLLLLCVLIVLPLRLWQGRTAAASMISGVVIAALTAFLTIYLVCLLYWWLHILNFWAIAIIGLVVQFFRTRRA